MTVYDQKPWIKSYDNGVPSHIEYPNITINQMFEETVKKYPKRIFTEFKGTEHSFSDLK
jgi:long-chain acyl-CoA synthetase